MMEMEAVAAFHNKHSILSQALGQDEIDELRKLGALLIKHASKIDTTDPDLRYVRAHFELEETGEWLIALATGNEVEFADALADKLYILLGHALIFGIPLTECFAEVHVSNMTKLPATEKVQRVTKGPNYVPPKIESVLAVNAMRTKPVRTNFVHELERRYLQRFRIAEIDDLPSDQRQMMLTLARRLKDKPGLARVLSEVAENIDNISDEAQE